MFKSVKMFCKEYVSSQENYAQYEKRKIKKFTVKRIKQKGTMQKLKNQKKYPQILSIINVSENENIILLEPIFR